VSLVVVPEEDVVGVDDVVVELGVEADELEPLDGFEEVGLNEKLASEELTPAA
jgi:hypothetical protein